VGGDWPLLKTKEIENTKPLPDPEPDPKPEPKQELKLESKPESVGAEYKTIKIISRRK
jgi:hypothetical protein